MLVSVIALNGYAVYGNNALRSATESLINELAGADLAAPVQMEMEMAGKETAAMKKKKDTVGKKPIVALKEAS